MKNTLAIVLWSVVGSVVLASCLVSLRHVFPRPTTGLPIAHVSRSPAPEQLKVKRVVSPQPDAAQGSLKDMEVYRTELYKAQEFAAKERKRYQETLEEIVNRFRICQNDFKKAEVYIKNLERERARLEQENRQLKNKLDAITQTSNRRYRSNRDGVESVRSMLEKRKRQRRPSTADKNISDRRQRELERRELRKQRRQYDQLYRKEPYVPTERTVEHQRTHGGEEPNEALVEYYKDLDQLYGDKE